MNGALGPVVFSHSPQIETVSPNTKIINMPILSINMSQNDYAEVTATVTTPANLNWRLYVGQGQGDATFLGVSSGTITSHLPNTYTFKSLLQANATGTVTLYLSASAGSNTAGVGEGLLLAKVVARG